MNYAASELCSCTRPPNSVQMRLIVSIFVVLLLCPCSQPATAAASAADWCAVEMRPVAAGSSIACVGVTSSALIRLNERLETMQLTLAEKVAEAERWARLYRDCIQRLHGMADHDPALHSVASQAERGRFEGAGALLERALES